MNNLTAADAIKMTKDVKSGTNIDGFIYDIDKSIKNRADQGQTFYEYVTLRHAGLYGPGIPDDIQWKAIRKHYIDNGFKVSRNALTVSMSWILTIRWGK